MSSSRYSGVGPERDEVTGEWKETEMGGACSKYMVEDRCKQGFREET